MTGSSWKAAVQNMADRHERCGHRFLPLVSPDWGLDCSLDILFLRRDSSVSYLIQGGDLDNRLKVLLDALKVPKDCDDAIRSWQETEDENPLYCLLQDDSLISEIKVTTDRLLLPLEEEEKPNHVVLIVHVKTRIVNMERAYIEML